MSLAQVLYPPPTQQGWNEWSLWHAQHHLAIERAILEVKGMQVVSFRLWPVSQPDFKDWLEQHQQAHTVFCNILNISGEDLTDLDMRDKTKADGWFFSHIQQHRAAASALKVPYL